MLILPPGHAQSVRSRGALSSREKRIIGAVLVAVAVLAVVLVISLLAAGPSSSNGCIYATIPAATGAQQIDQCGVQARATCQSATTPGAFTSTAAASIVAACRKAGLPVAP